MGRLWRSFLYGLSNTLGIAPIRRSVPTPEEEFRAVKDDLGETIELVRDHDLQPRRWRLPDGSIVADAVNPEAIELLKSDPDEYFRRTRRE